ncbi:gamma-tubulin complex component 4 [Artemisia annua]|uniref:Gamma-tubulin complex component 4 n=1 Tax=Artemisia annua TaxID=35608 RepID=A0A2U1LB43_ARTAN|nr:gamma-tubulin complex component 4 [Artemisia annua]
MGGVVDGSITTSSHMAHPYIYTMMALTMFNPNKSLGFVGALMEWVFGTSLFDTNLALIIYTAHQFHKRSFESAVDLVRAIAASHLWQLVVVLADLNGHLKAIKDYFLLAKGDFFQNLRPEIPRCCPNSLATVMKRCWDANPDKRPNMDEVVAMLEPIDTSKGHCSLGYAP